MIRRFDSSRRGKQRGLSLFIVAIMLLLTSLLVLWAARTSLLNEKITGNDSDYLRAVEAAQAMVQDAVLDINGETFPGVSCTVAGTVALTGNGCRTGGAVNISTNTAYYPASKGEFDDLLALLALGTPSCAGGICVPTNVARDFWSDETSLAAMKPLGAAYGSHTGAVAATVGNPLLLTSGTGTQQAWYWVELLPFTSATMFASGPAYVYSPNDGMPIYRITGIAEGRSGTRAVVQQIYVRKNESS